MAFCDFCKAEGQKTGTCAYCGTVYYTAGVTFIYGQTEKDSYGSEFRLTDKYLIVRSVSKAEMAGNVTAGAAFGLIGALAATAVDSARKKNYGFYDLQDLQKVIYPYHTNSLKKDTAFKFINKDGSDFVLNFNLNGMWCGKAAKNFADAIVKVGIFVENGANSKYPFCCTNPFVNQSTFATRVCQSAATFVRMTDQQFIAPPITANGSRSIQAQSTPGANPSYSQTIQKTPKYQVPGQQAPVPQMHPDPINSVSAVDTSAWQSAWQPTAQTIPTAANTYIAPTVEENNQTIDATSCQIMCPNCGAIFTNTSKFCSTCGTALGTIQSQTTSPFSVDDWKNKW